MDQAGRVALREDAALQNLKAKLGVPSGTQEYDQYLLRFLRNKNHDIDAADSKLQRRRDFEKTLPSKSVSEGIVTALRSGAFCVIGDDVFKRPVLYVRMGLHRFSDSQTDEKLALIILEYLQFVVQSKNVSEFVVVINEEHTGWFATKKAMQDQLLELLQKYYPELLGLVLVVNASWVVTQGVKTTVASQPSRIRNRTKVINRRELARAISPEVIPQELGGSKNMTGLAVDFSEHCLRYWFNMTTLIQQALESGGGFMKTKWQPTCSLVTNKMLLEPRNVVLHFAGGGKRNELTPGVNLPVGSSGGTSGGVASPTSSSYYRDPNATADDTTDDGCCSVISQDDLDQLAWDDREAGGDAARSRGGEEDSPTLGNGSTSPNSLQQQLSIETRRRKELETKVQSLELGAPVGGDVLTRLEVSLKGTHEEVNTLVGEVILKGKQKHRGDPSLLSLLELTNNALLQITQETPNVPAMRNTAPVDRRPPSSCVIS